ncbi:MAG: IS4 family transposase [Hydrococcus sp. CSU_1_8]|nr:IS4 family transposase [Hydrococcus sp. CSU_1_8]
MLPEFYRTCLLSQLTPAQLLTLEILVWLLQVHKQVKIERLATHFPLPILMESRRRHIQRFLILTALSIPIVWFPIIEAIIKLKFNLGERLYLSIDRTQWKDNNLFLVALIIDRRGIPIYWQFLDKRGASNLVEQQALLRPVLKLLKKYELVILGDREFHSVNLAAWLNQKKVYFVFRQKKDTNIKLPRNAYQQLNTLGLTPGMKMFLTGLKVTQQKGFGQANIGAYWKRAYRGKVEKDPWYLLPNFSNLSETLKAYKKRTGIEAMFKDCKSGGYNLESSKASTERLTRLVLLIAIAYTCSTLKGKVIKSSGQQKYIGRERKIKQALTKNSNFWLGLYGDVWIIAKEFVALLVEELMRLNLNKLPFYQKGLRAMVIIQQAL